MSNLMTRNDSTSGSTTLAAWNSAKSGSAVGWRTLTALFITLGGLTLLFLVVAIRPLGTTGLTLVCIGSATADPSENTAGDVSTISSHAFHDFAKTLRVARVEPPKTIAAMAGDGAKAWLADRKRNQPIMMHLVGAATVEADQAYIVPRQSKSSARPESIDLHHLFAQVARAGNPTIIVLDVIDVDQRSIGRLPELTNWQLARCIDATIDRYQDSPIMVVSGNEGIRSRADGGDKVSSLTRRIIHAFGPSADRNDDELISAEEWRRATVDGVDSGGGDPGAQSFSNRNGSFWHRVLLAPMTPAESVSTVARGDQDASSKDSVIAAKAIGKASSDGFRLNPVKASGADFARIETDDPSPRASIETGVTAVSLAMAIALRDDGIATSGSEQCDEIATRFRKILTIDAREQDAVEWLKSPAVSAASWEELVWARQVMELQIPWSLKQKLIKGLWMANELSVDRTVRQWFSEPWKVACLTRLDAQRSLVSPVRHDAAAYANERIDTAIRSMNELRQGARTVRKASEIRREVLHRLDEWVASPIHAGAESDDVICQLLGAVVDLDRWLILRRGTTIETCESLLKVVEDRLRAVERSSSQKKVATTTGPQASTADVESDRFLRATRIRIARSTLAIRLLRSGDVKTRSDSLDKLSATTIEVLGDPKASEKEMSDTVDAYRHAMRQSLSASEKGPSALTQMMPPVRWTVVLKSIAEEMTEFASDATPEERKKLAKSSSRCRRLAVAFNEVIAAMIPDEVELQAFLQGSLATSDEAVLQLSVRPKGVRLPPGRWEVEIDPLLLTAEVIGDEPSAVGVREIGQVLPNEQAESGASATSNTENSSPSTATVRLRRKTRGSQIAGRASDSAVNVRWVTADRKYRQDVPLEMPLTDFCRISLAPGGSPSRTADQIVMHANRSAFVLLRLHAIDPEVQAVKIRLLSWATPLPAIPPTMDEVQSERWFSRHGRPDVLAVMPRLVTQFGDRTPVLFPTQKLDPTLPPETIGTLLCEVTDLQQKRVQMIDLSPRVQRPSSLIAPVLAFDLERRRLTVEIHGKTSDSPFASPPARVQIELRDQVTRKRLGNSEAIVAAGETLKKIFSTAASIGHPIMVRLLVDDWPSSFVYKIEGDRSEFDVRPADDQGSVTITQPEHEIIVGKSVTTIEAAVWADVSDHLFRYGQDMVSLGMDINGDRILADEPEVSVTTPVEIQFQWLGIAGDGSFGIQSKVGPHRLSLPVGLLRNRRVSLMASLRRGGLRAYSRPLEVVSDELAPKVQATQIFSPLPAVSGVDVMASITVDDQGLSGEGAVQAGWAVAGERAFTKNVKPVQAQKMNDGHWKVSITTSGLASGVHELLVQATDKAGNVGDVKSVLVHIYTAKELAAIKANQATAVQGHVAYVKQPVAGMTVSLIPQDEPKPESPSDSYNIFRNGDESGAVKSNLPESVRTNADGRFIFERITAGNYRLKVEGLYRGMNRKASIPVAVNPPTPVMVAPIRID